MKGRPSARFRPTGLTEKLVPVLLVIILLGLLAVIVVVTLASLGFTPGA